jgi:5'(3')-deoxyribonucleotidase
MVDGNESLKNISNESEGDIGAGKYDILIPKLSNKVALVDMDGTLVDYAGQLEKDLKGLRGPEEPNYEINWNEKLPDHIWNRIKLIKKSKDWWYNLPNLSDGFKLLDTAIEIGYEIHVLTKGPKETKTAWTQKVRWCEDNLPEDTNVTITHDKSLVYGRILIDDYPGYVEGWLRYRPRSLVVMPLRPWNKDYKHSNVIHYDDSVRGNNYEEVRVRMQEQFDRD